MQRQHFGRRQSWLARIFAKRQFFPERQIIVRAKGEVSYLSLSRSMQAGAAVEKKKRKKLKKNNKPKSQK